MDDFHFCPYCGATRAIGNPPTAPAKITDQGPAKRKAYSVAAVREKHPQAYAKWDATEDQNLATEFRKSMDIGSIAKLHGRRPGAIRSRLVKLGLLISDGDRADVD